MDVEAQELQSEIGRLQAFMSKPRFDHTRRLYTPKQVAVLRQSVSSLNAPPQSNVMAQKFYSMCRTMFDRREHTLTFGCLDPIQVVQMAKYMKCIYVSGWQSSSTASTSNEPGPDFADYPCNTIPNKVDQLFRAQLFHDRKQNEERARMSSAQRQATPKIDYMLPIIADGDTGFGGVTSVMKLIKMQVQAGAAAVHIEDQRPGAKKCGHMGGKVLCATSELIDRLSAARLQADILGAETVLIARTDAESATLIDSNHDPRDHPFIGGVTVDMGQSLEQAIAEGAKKGQSADDVSKAWLNKAKVMTYPDAVASAMKARNKGQEVKAWLNKAHHMSHFEARELARKLGFGDVFWCWEQPRTREGYYRAIGSIESCVSRAISFQPYADLVWMETSKPDVKEAKEFASMVHAVCPTLMLAYNCSPSFNWDRYLDEEGLKNFNKELAKLGFVWQFTTLAGFHCDALAIDKLAKDMSQRGSIAYVQGIQREEQTHRVETWTHQKWSGTELLDAMLQTATGGSSSTSSMGEGVTEAAFSKAKL
eukprot:gb/GEZN01003031.1/.p1 GENE.gb/GEZN01003031.1/~~gb/GEZN01003031.1/.p1  ORF type:complete len:536 (-),score=76.06 gb/GEZN01003031.1/:654-2261(-)